MNVETIVTRPCEVGRCTRWDATRFDACGTVYVCPACREQMERLAAVLYGASETEAARLAEKAQVAS